MAGLKDVVVVLVGVVAVVHADGGSATLARGRSWAYGRIYEIVFSSGSVTSPENIKFMCSLQQVGCFGPTIHVKFIPAMGIGDVESRRERDFFFGGERCAASFGAQLFLLCGGGSGGSGAVDTGEILKCGVVVMVT